MITHLTDRKPRGVVPHSIEVFADVLCPFTHVGLRRLVARRTELGRDDPRAAEAARELVSMLEQASRLEGQLSRNEEE